jgi:hypothetical protein
MTTFIGLKPSVEGRFLAKFTVSDGCWEWTGAQRFAGYGTLKVNGKSMLAHRYAWYWYYGEMVPNDMVVDHLCRNTLCVNPTHLEVVTHAENIKRGLKGDLFPGHCPAGHDYTPENTLINRKGSPVCRTCKRSRERKV